MTKRKKFDIDQVLREFRRKGGGSRHSILRVLGDKLDRYGAAFHKERLQFEDEKEGPRVVDIVQTGTCSFGHVIDDKVHSAGVCEIGGEVLCTSEGCMRSCVHCGRAVCRAHSRTYDDGTYCCHCIWVHYWRALWRLE